MCSPEQIKKYGAKPANIQWTVVRGDTAVLKVEFYEQNGTTQWDTDGWIYNATSYDPQGNVLDALEVTPGEGYVTITAQSCITEKWGTGYKEVVAELMFDLVVEIPQEGPDNYIWTPVIGTIRVLGDVTPSNTL